MKAKWKKTGGIMLAAVVVLGALAARLLRYAVKGKGRNER